MFYNMTVLFLLMCQIPARTRCIFVFRDFECIGGGVNDTVAAVGGTAQGVDVKALFFFHLPYHVRCCTEKVFLGVAVGKDGDVGHFLVFYRYLHFDIPAEGIGGTRVDAVFQVMETAGVQECLFFFRCIRRFRCCIFLYSILISGGFFSRILSGLNQPFTAVGGAGNGIYLLGTLFFHDFRKDS